MSNETAALCYNTSVTCSVSTKRDVYENSVIKVIVTGKENTSARLRMFQIKVVDGVADGLTPLGKPFTVNLDAQGRGEGWMPGPSPSPGGGWVLVSLEDTTWTGNPADIIGSAAHFGSKNPTVLGDGFGTDKPVGQPIQMDFINSLSSMEYVVEYQADDKAWYQVGSGEPTTAKKATEVTSIEYQVPQGLAPRDYMFRLRNITADSSTPYYWHVRPSKNAQPQPRKKPLDFNSVGSNFDTVQVTTHHPVKPALIGLGSALAASCALAAVTPVIKGRRRSGDH
ncbi:hypothetical protein O6R08_10335 [Cutibacterium equinum]|uniref:Uncharacterized protein n=1 Tax=Cutibacterium equinum TaxID=3016342 RepID=A0ABY7QZ85_9ACTN|nr:hypothetical protein [Cutibacterium equinum]WCC79842.1 hypothetical protein O6R08_10335 [Cutibacterium equinum]